jgi:hypothetical protein
MKAHRILRKSTLAAGVAALVIALGSGAGFAASEFQGTWKSKDTQGNPLQIVLSEDGKAKGDRAGEGMTGTWKADGDAVVINWDTGWTTKISKQGSTYKKTAYEKGQSGGAGQTTDATKVQ